jgi:hypothetical protein
MTTQFQSVDEAAAHYDKQQNDTHVKRPQKKGTPCSSAFR